MSEEEKEEIKKPDAVEVKAEAEVITEVKESKPAELAKPEEGATPERVKEDTKEAPRSESKSEEKSEAKGGEPEKIEKDPVKEEPKYDVPEKIIVNEFREKPLAELHEILDSLPIKSHTMAMKSQLVFDILSFYGKHGTELEGYGFMEQAKDNYAMLRCHVERLADGTRPPHAHYLDSL